MKKAFLTMITSVMTVFLFLFCTACDEGVVYTVNFMVDGSVYATISADSTETVTLPDNPTKEGYDFVGWYLDDGVWEQQITEDTVIEDPPSTEVEVYAYFVESHSHEWGEISYVWSADNSTCTATRICNIDSSHIETETVNSVYEITTEATYDNVGVGKYTATFNITEFSAQEKTTEIPKKFYSATITGIDGATKTVNNLKMFVDKTTESVALSSIVHTVPDCTWGLYYDYSGANEIPSKTATQEDSTFDDGDNVFYIIVRSNDGITVNTYTLTIYHSFDVEVKYYQGETLLYTDTVETNTLYTADYVFAEAGYTLNKWLNADDEEYVAHKIWGAENIYADTSIRKFNIIFNSDGGSAVTTISQDYDTAVEAPSTTKIGYTFNGWFEEGSTNKYAFNKIEARNVALTASWTINKYTITFYSTGGSAVETINQDYNTNVVEPASTYLGYVFNGWFEDGSDERYAFNKIEARDVILIAKWTSNADLDNFYFSSGGDFITVTGLKDKTLSKVVIPDYITGITVDAFAYCTQLLSITIGSGVYSVGIGAFRDCFRLVEIINRSELSITKGSTDYGHVAYNALTVHNEASKIVERDGYVFITVDEINYLIDYNGTATAITLPSDYNGENYKIHDYAFYKYENLTSITIENGVLEIGKYAFRSCVSITSLTIGDCVTDIGNFAFANCMGLTTLTLGNCLNSIGSNAFQTCTGLLSVTIGSSVNSIGFYAFENCVKLVEVINKSALSITAGSTDNNYLGYYALTVHSGDSEIVNQDGYLFISHGDVNYLIGYNGTATELTLPSNYNGEDYEILYRAFYGCTAINSITMVSGITSIGESAFWGCKGLTSVVISDSVTEIGESAFNLCTGLLSVSIGSGVDNIPSKAFETCTALTSVTIGDNVNSIGERAFYGCTKIASVTMGANVSSIGGGAFMGCQKLKNINFGGTKEQWGEITKGPSWNVQTSAYTIHCSDGNLAK